MTATARAALEARYQKAAKRYEASLPLEHFMDLPDHATQRKISWDSLGLLAAKRPDVHVFNELLVQYPLPRRRKPGQVVPDNMVVIYDGPLEPDLSYNTPLVKPRPFWMLEYVSKNSTRKDYVDNMRRYERDLKVPYYLLFDLRKQKLTLYRHNGKRYDALTPNSAGRLEVPELELELAILDEWVRFWHKGKLLPLPADMQRGLESARQEIAELRKQLDALKSRRHDSQ
ncbi:MAG TPA: Uma2 family endonuclease [Gemmataceae bacterium]|nr:Uma2 family endonuclease [Gemmataceae bacterium]